MVDAKLIEELKSRDDLEKLPEAERALLLAQMAELLEQQTAHNRVAHWRPYEWQQRALEVLRKKLITLAIAPNKIGKTALGTCVIWSWLHGYEPWNPVDATSAGAVKVDRNFYNPSSLGIKPPVDLIIVGEDWKLHLGKTIVRELKKWYPKTYATKKNEQGVDYSWKFPNKSELTLMAYSQEDDLFESFRAQGVLMDEPPPQSKFGAMSRGLLLDAGKVMMTLTPLKEAWILDDLVLSGRADVGIVDGLRITANPDLEQHDMRVLEKMGLSKTQIARYWDLLFYKDAA